MDHLGMFTVWFLLISQSNCGWVDNILHNLPDVNVPKIVEEAKDDVKATDVQKVLRTASEGAEKAVKNLEDNVEDINLNKMVKEASTGVKDLGKAVEHVSNDVKAIDVQKSLRTVSKDAEKAVKKLEDNVEDTLDVLLVKKMPRVDATGCKCYGYDCGCCVDMDIAEIKLNDTVCAKVTYLQSDYGISVTLSINGVVHLYTTVSARNPPPLCFEIPDLKHLASACIKFYDMDVSKKTFHGCVELELELVHVRIIHQDLGCFNIPLTDAGNSSRIS